MQHRLEFHEILCEILGSRNVYFQPPASIAIQYPCILYMIKSKKPEFANDFKYQLRDCYDVIYVDRDPDSDVPDRISDLELSAFDRHYIADNLHHSVYSVYF